MLLKIFIRKNQLCILKNKIMKEKILDQYMMSRMELIKEMISKYSKICFLKIIKIKLEINLLKLKIIQEITKIYLSKSLSMAHFHRLNQTIIKLPNFKIKKIKIFYITIITSKIRKIRQNQKTIIIYKKINSNHQFLQ